MGGKGSTLTGKATVDERLMRFTGWGKDELKAMATRHFHDLGGKFALGPRQVAMLLGVDEEVAHPIFGEIFDTDRNQLVDAFEIIGAMAMLSKLSLRDKVSMIHQLYDFNGSGDITIDEMTIMFRTLAVACAKMDAKVIAPPVAEVEELAQWAFRKADRDNDGEISRAEFDIFVFTNPQVSHLLGYFSGAMNHEAIAPGAKFSDPDLAPAATTLYSSAGGPPLGAIPAEEVCWLRPEEFMPGTPKLFDPKTIGSVVQGQLSDSWLLSALSALASKPAMLRSIFVPTGQEDAGRYCVRFFTEGKATHVIVDDIVPCDPLMHPLFARSSDPCEIWPMLVEKAFAKLHGCYEILLTGSTEAALTDLTGGTVETTKLHSKQALARFESGALWKTLVAAAATEGIVAASRKKHADDADESGSEMWQGIVCARSYGVVRAVELKGTKLVQLSNRWCGSTEYAGPWSASAPEWGANPEVKAACAELTVSEEAGGASSTFWMAFDDFVAGFTTVWMCELYDETLWTRSRRLGTWPSEGGGCLNYGSWVQNPQLYLDVPPATIGAKVVIVLTQADEKTHRAAEDAARSAIGLVVQKFHWGNDKTRVKRLTKVSKSTLQDLTQPFAPTREVITRLELDTGKFCIVPMTFAPRVGGRYWITVLSTAQVTLHDESEVIYDEATLPDVGVTELEQDSTELTAAELEDVDLEPEHEAHALASLATLVSELWVQARALEAEKGRLQARLKALEDGA